jgi:acyl-CoA hydrolase
VNGNNLRDHMTFYHLVGAPSLNSGGTLHGGVLAKWIDEDAGTHALLLTGGPCVTRSIKGIDFIQAGRMGDILRIETWLIRVGKTSIELAAGVVNERTGSAIAGCPGIVFVHVDENHRPKAHGIRLGRD